MVLEELLKEPKFEINRWGDFRRDSTVDADTYSVLNLHMFPYYVMSTATALGQNTIEGLLRGPPMDIELVNAKQDSIREIFRNQQLQEFLSSYLESRRSGAHTLMSMMTRGYFDDRWLARHDHKGSVEFLNSLPVNFPETNDAYLSILFSRLSQTQSMEQSRPIYRREREWVKKAVTLRFTIYDDSALNHSIDAFSRLDEIFAYTNYLRKTKSSIPEVENCETHHLTATEATHPYYAKKKFVPNDIDLNGQKIFFVTGPNSGGKTTYSTMIAMIQIMGQLGMPVPAQKASISIADRVRYAVPDFAANEDEGTFGTEMARVRNIFFTATPKSLTLLDDIAAGTTIQEELEQAAFILKAFYLKGGSTVLATHRHELATLFQENGIGAYLMGNFNQDKPTYQITPGISSLSHADFVMKRIGFSRHDVERQLQRRGYLPEGQSVEDAVFH